MPRHRLTLPALAALGALAAVHLAGCTAIGFGFGAMGDMAVGKQAAGGLSKVRTGTNVTMWLSDGRKLHGRFLGCRDSVDQTPLPVPPIEGQGTVVPLRAVLILGTGAGLQQIPIQDVRRVSVPVARGKVVGLLVGMVLDATIVLASYMGGGLWMM